MSKIIKEQISMPLSGLSDVSITTPTPNYFLKWNGAAWVDSAAPSALSLTSVGSAPNANAATLSSGVLNLEPANASYPGVVTTGSQTFAGVKTLNDIWSYNASKSFTPGSNELSSIAYVDNKSWTASYIFLAELSTPQSNVTGDGTEVIYIFDNETKDIGGCYNPATGRFTAPFNCMATFVANISTTADAGYGVNTNVAFSFIRKNSGGSEVQKVLAFYQPCSGLPPVGAANLIEQNISASFILNSGDTVSVIGQVSGNTSKNVSFNQSISQRFSGFVTYVG